MEFGFSVAARVQVSNESSQYRGHLGTVLADNGDGTGLVRLDGAAPTAEGTLFNGADLRPSTQPCPLEY